MAKSAMIDDSGGPRKSKLRVTVRYVATAKEVVGGSGWLELLPQLLVLELVLVLLNVLVLVLVLVRVPIGTRHRTGTRTRYRLVLQAALVFVPAISEY